MAKFCPLARYSVSQFVTSELTMTTSGPIAEFWEHLAAGRFMLQRSRSTGGFVFYPRVLFPTSGEQDLEWVEASGSGIVYASTLIWRPEDQGGNFNISLIELSEGPRMLSRVIGITPDAVRIGMSVTARIELPTWKPVPPTQPVVVFYSTD
jgi:uncharacterized OB-fold protein